MSENYPSCEVCESGGIAAEGCPNCHSKVTEYWKQKYIEERLMNDRLIGWLAFKLCQTNKLSKEYAFTVVMTLAHSDPDWSQIEGDKK